MFSRYKQGGAGVRATNKPHVVAPPKTAPVAEQPATSFRKPAPMAATVPVGIDKERKRKERISEIKIELHRALLDNLNLAALDTATEADLRTEIKLNQ